LSEEATNWSDTLQDYLAHSNEDQEVVGFFAREVVERLRGLGAIDWLEIGPGPGSKTFGLYSAIMEAGLHIGSAALVEPDPNWEPEFSRAAREFKERHPASVDFTVNRAGLAALLSATEVLGMPIPNLITCIHVLYDEGIIEPFGRYLRFLIDKASAFTAFTVIESEVSDFYGLRQQLAAEGFHVPASAAPAIEETLSRFEIAFETSVIDGQTCTVSQQALSSWFPPFLLGVSESRFHNYSREEKHALNSIIENYLVRRPGRSLNIPDIAFIVSSGKLQYD
jgi:hypothetical protein